MKELILVFDKDGVLIDSEHVKLATLEKVFDAYPQYAEVIHQYNYRTVGIPRMLKFQHICREILQLPNPDVAVEAFSEAYTKLVDESLKSVPQIAGIRDYLTHRPERKYVCSAAPKAEVLATLKHQKLAPFFEDFFAYPEAKAEVMLRLKQQHQAEIVFWGDTLADYQAAQKANVCFIGLTTASENPFSHLNIPCIPDFSAIKEIDDIIIRYVEGL